MVDKEKILKNKIQRLVDEYVNDTKHCPIILIQGYNVKIEKGERLWKLQLR